MAAPRKPRLGVFKFASCDGCQLSLLDCEDELLAVAQLDRFGGQQSVEAVVDAFNAERHRLPWLENRQVVVSLTPLPRRQGDP